MFSVKTLPYFILIILVLQNDMPRGFRSNRRVSTVLQQQMQALEQIRPSLQADGGDVKLISVEDDGVVKVQLQGACHGCPMSQMTLQMGIKTNLQEMVPGVTDVVAV